MTDPPAASGPHAMSGDLADVDRLASLALDGELDDDAARALAADPGATARLHAMTQVRDLVASPVAAPDPQIVDRQIARALESATSSRPAAVTDLSARRNLRRGPMAAVAAVVLLALLVPLAAVVLRSDSQSDEQFAAVGSAVDGTQDSADALPEAAAPSADVEASSGVASAAATPQLDDADDLREVAAAAVTPEAAPNTPPPAPSTTTTALAAPPQEHAARTHAATPSCADAEFAVAGADATVVASFPAVYRSDPAVVTVLVRPDGTSVATAHASADCRLLASVEL